MRGSPGRLRPSPSATPEGASFRCWRVVMRYRRWPVQRLRMSRCLSPKFAQKNGLPDRAATATPEKVLAGFRAAPGPWRRTPPAAPRYFQRKVSDLFTMQGLGGSTLASCNGSGRTRASGHVSRPRRQLYAGPTPIGGGARLTIFRNRLLYSDSAATPNRGSLWPVKAASISFQSSAVRCSRASGISLSSSARM